MVFEGQENIAAVHISFDLWRREKEGGWSSERTGGGGGTRAMVC